MQCSVFFGSGHCLPEVLVCFWLCRWIGNLRDKLLLLSYKPDALNSCRFKHSVNLNC